MIQINVTKISGSNGAIWGTESDDLNATLVRWDAGKGVDAHVNSAVDVVMTVDSGDGSITVDDELFQISSGSELVIPKGALREITAGNDGITYLNVHQRRPKLMPNMARQK